MKMQKAAIRATGELTNGSAAMRGEMRILPMVIALGRFIYCLCKGLQHELAHRFQCIEHSVSADCDCLEVWSSLDPVTTRELLDEILAGVVQVRGDARTGNVRRLPSRVERSLQIRDWRGVWK